MSFIPVLQYGAGAAILGFTGWILSGILDDIIAVGVHETGTVFSFFNYLWTGIFIVYLVFGGWWLVRKYNENEYNTGGLM